MSATIEGDVCGWKFDGDSTLHQSEDNDEVRVDGRWLTIRFERLGRARMELELMAELLRRNGYKVTREESDR